MPSMISADCPRCGERRMTLDVINSTMAWEGNGARIHLSWEAFCRCRSCYRSAVIILQDSKSSDEAPHSHDGQTINYRYTVTGIVRPQGALVTPPAYVPDDVAMVFREGAECLAIGCWNAAGAMFRKVVDVVSRSRLPDGEGGPNDATRNNLKRRLAWLFLNNHLTRDVEPLAACIREDGNDAVHDHPLTKEDAEDLLDFTVQLLEGVYTTPGKLAAAAARRDERRNK